MESLRELLEDDGGSRARELRVAELAVGHRGTADKAIRAQVVFISYAGLVNMVRQTYCRVRGASLQLIQFEDSI